jgi:hypothetical protein
MMEDDENGDDGWKILKPGVVLFETTIGLVSYLILEFLVGQIKNFACLFFIACLLFVCIDYWRGFKR